MGKENVNAAHLATEFPVAYKLGFDVGVQIRSCGLQVKTVSKRFKNPYGRKTPEYTAFDYGKLEGYSKIPRVLEYLPSPSELKASCPKCGSSALEWSEWENHIWCNTCENETDDFQSDLKTIDPEILKKSNKWDKEKQILECVDAATGQINVQIVNSSTLLIQNSLPVTVENLSKNEVHLVPFYSENFSKGEWWKEYSEKYSSSPESFENTYSSIEEMMNNNRIVIVRPKGKFNLLEIEF